MNENQFKLKLINHQIIKIKFTLNKIGKLAETALLNTSRVDRETIWPFGASETDLGDRETVPGHQGGAVVPDSVATHEEIRPETHLLVRTECKK